MGHRMATDDPRRDHSTQDEGCPESPEKGDPSTRELLRRADSTGPVSLTCNRFIRPKAGNAP